MVWKLPQSLPGSPHALKYRLAYVSSGKCIVRTGQGPVGVRALARQFGRDVKGVHTDTDTDTQVFVQCGVLDKSDDGKVAFPYDAVHEDFTISGAA